MEKQMKIFLAFLIFSAIFAIFTVLDKTLDLRYTESIVERMESMSPSARKVQAIAFNVGVNRIPLKSVLANLEKYGERTIDRDKHASIERVILGEYGRLLEGAAQRCPQANNYIGASVSGAVSQVITSKQASQWLIIAEGIC
jgi:curli biogenesis system outer membrane secretion channel CsgG